MPLLLPFTVEQPQRTCPGYRWDASRGQLVFTGYQEPQDPSLPADLAVYLCEQQVRLPVFLLLSHSLPSGTRVEGRLIGALLDDERDATAWDTVEDARAQVRYLVACAHQDPAYAHIVSLEDLPIGLLSRLMRDASTHAFRLRPIDASPRVPQQNTGAFSTTAPARVRSTTAQEAALLLRRMRLLCKKHQHAQHKRGNPFLQPEEPAIAWRAIEGLAPSLRAALREEAPMTGDVPYAHAEHLLRWIPPRFQSALADLLLDDERVLGFLERPPLRQYRGWLGLHSWRSTHGVLLLTDRQVLWLRDFMTPGTSGIAGGYVAHSLPLERLTQAHILAPGRLPDTPAFSEASSFLRLALEEESSAGREQVLIEFPVRPESEHALERIVDMLSAWLPRPPGREDRRLRRLPEVESWHPQGTTRQQLDALGGALPPALREQMEQHLRDLLTQHQEQLLIAVPLAALEEAHCPPRLIGLTRDTLFILEQHTEPTAPFSRRAAQVSLASQRVALHTITSVEMRSSLFGSHLRYTLPGSSGMSTTYTFPFHSPALARLLPLFARVRLLLNTPVPTSCVLHEQGKFSS